MDPKAPKVHQEAIPTTKGRFRDTPPHSEESAWSAFCVRFMVNNCNMEPNSMPTLIDKSMPKQIPTNNMNKIIIIIFV